MGVIRAGGGLVCDNTGSKREGTPNSEPSMYVYREAYMSSSNRHLIGRAVATTGDQLVNFT